MQTPIGFAAIVAPVSTVLECSGLFQSTRNRGIAGLKTQQLVPLSVFMTFVGFGQGGFVLLSELS